MHIQKVVDLSGLSRGQINQLISRHGIGVHGRLLRTEVHEGAARDFTPADAFAFCIGGRAAALGCNMTTVRDLIISFPIPAVDPATFRQRAIFDGYRRDVVHLLVAKQVAGEWVSKIVLPEKVYDATKKAPVALVFPATEIARAIEDVCDE